MSHTEHRQSGGKSEQFDQLNAANDEFEPLKTTEEEPEKRPNQEA